MQRLDGPASNRDEATCMIQYHRGFMVRKQAGREPEGGLLTLPARVERAPAVRIVLFDFAAVRASAETKITGWAYAVASLKEEAPGRASLV